MRKPSIRKLLYALALALISFIGGIAGYMLLEDYSLREAFYMTMITVSTVGFREVRDLSAAGQVFTSFYILYNLGTVAYLISVISTYVFEGELRTIFMTYISKKLTKSINRNSSTKVRVISFDFKI